MTRSTILWPTAADFPTHGRQFHVSGVVNQEVSLSQMRDGHRVLVTPGDRLGNIDQIAALQAAGYAGPISYEAFHPKHMR